MMHISLLFLIFHQAGGLFVVLGEDKVVGIHRRWYFIIGSHGALVTLTTTTAIIIHESNSILSRSPFDQT